LGISDSNKDYIESGEATRLLARTKSEHNFTDKQLMLQPNVKKQGFTMVSPTREFDSPFNSENFFTKNFDESEMDDVLEQLKSSSATDIKNQFNQVQAIGKSAIFENQNT
jgi:hypothetical protein